MVDTDDREVVVSRDDLRKGRRSLPRHAYCITAVTKARKPLFEDLISARLLIREIRHAHVQGDVSSIAWVVMPDHLHWMFQLRDHHDLSGIVKSVKARSSLHVNRHLGRSGTMWQKAFYDYAVRRDEDIRRIARYIVANPLRAGLVEQIGDYPHWDCIWMRDSHVVAVI